MFIVIISLILQILFTNIYKLILCAWSVMVIKTWCGFQLLEWIAKTRPWLEDRSTNSTLQMTRSRLDEFSEYRSQHKPPKLEEKGKLETTFNTLQTRLRLSGRPAYIPATGKLVSVSGLLFCKPFWIHSCTNCLV